ncbi:MAG: nuclear transport factor 2 family protein [Planctomycetota bacterium]|jgi:pimeloyl-ACP methyl ester carboxylesterase
MTDRTALLVLLTLIALASSATRRVCADGADRPPQEVVGSVEWRTLDLADGTTVEYALVLPANHRADRPAPALLALPPGPQDRRMVEAGIGRYWGRQASERGWIVVSPAAPNGQRFFEGGERVIPPLLDAISGEFAIEGNAFHLAGNSNGGRGAFRVAGLHPDRFLSLTVLPGFPPAAEDEARLERLKDMPVFMYVGGDDRRWRERTEQTRVSLEALGVDVQATVLTGEGHVPPSLDGTVVMEHLDGVRKTMFGSDDRGSIASVLDALHDAASRADGARYFALFAPGAVFFGTDATERWTIEEFRSYAQARFDAGQGWTYAVTERHVTVGDRRRTAWFDEMLHNEKYGVCRGTGVLVKAGGEWRIAQYHLTIPVPNDLASEVVRMIRERAAAAPAGSREAGGGVR